MRHRELGIAVVITLVAVAQPASAVVNLTSAGGYLFDIYETTYGYVSNGTSDAYDGCYNLRINGVDYNAGGAAALVDGRTVTMATITMSTSLSVTRQAHVPATGGDYIRYYDTLENTGTATVTVTVGYYCNFGSDSSTVIWGSYSGDTVADTSDYWFGSDDADGSGDPSLAHAYFGDGALTVPTAVSTPTGTSTVDFSVDVAPGEVVGFLVFGFQGPNRASVETQVEDLVLDVGGATDDMDGGDLAVVVNWGLAGAPIIRWVEGQPFNLPEGGTLEMNASVEDREGDSFTVSWDLDDDGEHDDASGESVLVSAAGLDGPTSMFVGVHAEDALGNASDRRIELTVDNAPPELGGDPPVTEILIGEEWSYTPEITDPGGDDVEVEVVGRPPGSVLLAGGGIRWTPAEEDVGEHPLQFLATDDDDDPEVEGDGDAMIEFTLTVSENGPPTAPTVVSPGRAEELAEVRPTLVVTNPTDPEGDQLRIFFEVSTSDTFSAPIASEGQAPGTDGNTSWTVTEDLQDGVRYYWRAWANDGRSNGPRVSSFFFIDLRGGDDGGPDGGPDAGPDDGGPTGPVAEPGCACRAGGAGSGAGGLALLLIALALGLAVMRR